MYINNNILLHNNIFWYNITKMAGNSEWNKAVKSAFETGRKTNKSFSLKDAMFAAKKIYRKSKNSTMRMMKRSSKRISFKKRRNTRRNNKK